MDRGPTAAPSGSQEQMNNDQAVLQRHGWLVANLVAQLAFGLLAMTICLPSMQEWPATFGASQAAVQLTFSGYVAAFGGLQLAWGPLSDRVGRKPILMCGLALACAGSVLGALAPDLWVLTMARILQGAGCAAGTVIGRATVQDLFTGRERTLVMAMVGMAMGVCPPLAMLIGGQLHVRLGWQANFVVMAVLAAVLLLAAWRGLPAPGRGGTSPAKGWGDLFAGYGRLAREPAFVLFVVVLASSAATFYTFLGGAPLLLKAYGVTPEHIGWYIMFIPVAYIFGNILTTHLIARLGDRAIMATGQFFTVSGLCLVLALALAGFHSPLALALPLVLLGIGHGLLVPPALVGTVGVVPALAGTAAAVTGLMQQLTGAVGGFVVGLVPHEAPLNLALQMLGWALCGVAAQAVLYRVVLRRR